MHTYIHTYIQYLCYICAISVLFWAPLVLALPISRNASKDEEDDGGAVEDHRQKLNETFGLVMPQNIAHSSSIVKCSEYSTFTISYKF